MNDFLVYITGRPGFTEAFINSFICSAVVFQISLQMRNELINFCCISETWKIYQQC
ncbi:unnamed protein product, partial [Schistosoma haematobium]